MHKLVRTGVACALLMGGASATAAMLPFTGTVTGVSTLIGADPTCAPLQFRAVINQASTVGHSSLGDFTYGTNTCLAPAGLNAPSFGTFTIDFGADSFNGTFDGGSTLSQTPGISDTAWLFTILGGTGRFEGASGTFQGAGLADARTRPTHVAISFIGDINSSTVPEPGTWSMLLFGFAGLGLRVRLRRNASETLLQIA